jgi:hypothetical protein
LYTGTVNIQGLATGNGTDGAVAGGLADATDTLTFTVAGAGPSTVTNIPVTYSIVGTGADLGGGGSNNATLYFGNAAFGQEFGEDGSIGSPSISGWTSDGFTSDNANLIVFNGVYSITGPSAVVGLTEILQGGENLGAQANYTGTVTIGPTPGVSYTSASGVFDTVVPEPASASLLIACAGTLALRRRKSSLSAA